MGDNKDLDGMVCLMKRQDSLTSCERQFQHDTETMIQQWQGVKSCESCESFNQTIKDTTKYRSEKQTTNFCSLKKQTLQTFVVFKKQTLQTFLVNGLCIVVFCIQSISKLCSLCSTFCSLL
jgi:hypothetical protein